MHLHSFWWRVFKRAWKNSWEPFESFGRICALIAGMVAIAFIAHFVTQEWGDYMIYWTIALPVIVWWVWFFWNLIKVPHEIHEEDLAEARSGTLPVSIKKSGIQNFVRFGSVVIIVSAFMGLLAEKNWQIAQLKKQQIPPKRAALPKPLPMKSIPAPEVTQPVVTQKTENPPPPVFESDFVPTNSSEGESILEKIQEQQSNADLARKLETEKAIYDYWTNALPYYKQTILLLRDGLRDRAKTNNETIETYPTPQQFFQCLPGSVSPEDSDKTFGEIKLTRNTNMDFTISATSLGAQYYGLKISCSSGYLLVHPYGSQFFGGLKL